MEENIEVTEAVETEMKTGKRGPYGPRRRERKNAPAFVRVEPKTETLDVLSRRRGSTVAEARWLGEFIAAFLTARS